MQRRLLAVEGHSRSLFQRARAPHAYIRRASQGPQGRVVPFAGVHGKARIVGYVLHSQQRRPGRAPRFIGGAYHHRQYTVRCLCVSGSGLGVRRGGRGPGIAELSV
jgi:hypothetical protein